MEDSGASCQPTVTEIMSTPQSTACCISSKHSSSRVAAPAVHQFGAVEADDQRIVRAWPA